MKIMTVIEYLGMIALVVIIGMIVLRDVGPDATDPATAIANQICNKSMGCVGASVSAETYGSRVVQYMMVDGTKVTVLFVLKDGKVFATIPLS
jgi:hypothetical protein